MNKNPVVITLRHVTKTFPLHAGKPTLMGHLLGKHKKSYTALRDISLTIIRGERVGLVGPNGAGKTTLLRIISGSTTPTHGTAEIIGKVISLIELGVGFHQEMSGRENILLQALILGMGKTQAQKEIRNIIRFADIGSFIEEPVHTYSLGMKLRLAFAIAVHSHPDILLLDEAIGVGDTDFRKKCDKKIQELARQGTTIVIVTHWVQLTRRYCKKIVWIEKGKIVKQGGLSMISQWKSN